MPTADDSAFPKDVETKRSMEMNRIPVKARLLDTPANHPEANAMNLKAFVAFYENGRPLDEWACMHAAYDGHLEGLKCAQEVGCPRDEST